MAERKRETGGWVVETDDAPAPGKHGATGTSQLEETSKGGRSPEEDAPDDAAPAEQESASASAERTEVIPRGTLRAADAEGFVTPARDARAGLRRPRPVARRVRRTLRHVDPVGVLKLSLFYYACFVVLWLLFAAVLYTALSATGLVERVERLGQALVLWENIDISLWLVERWAFLIGLICALFASLVNLFLAFLYNLAADIVGGVETTFIDRDN